MERSNINPIGGDDVVISIENRDIVKNVVESYVAFVHCKALGKFEKKFRT